MEEAKKKVLIVITGFIITFILLEVGLRIIGYIHLNKMRKKGRSSQHKSKYTILCVGDSFTYGLGAPSDMAYPKQLERMLKDHFGKNEVDVINKGGGGCNTSHLLYRRGYKIKESIKNTPPEVVILMVGGQNLWNYWGYGKYMQERGIISRVKDLLYRIRIFKLAKLLYTNIRKERDEKELNDKDTQNGIKCLVDKNFFSLDKYERNKNYIKLAKNFAEDGEYKKAIRLYKKGVKNYKKKKIIGAIYGELGKLHWYIGNFAKAIKLTRKAIKHNPEDFDSYHILGELYERIGLKGKALKAYKNAVRVNPCYF